MENCWIVDVYYLCNQQIFMFRIFTISILTDLIVVMKMMVRIVLMIEVGTVFGFSRAVAVSPCAISVSFGSVLTEKPRVQFG